MVRAHPPTVGLVLGVALNPPTTTMTTTGGDSGNLSGSDTSAAVTTGAQPGTTTTGDGLARSADRGVLRLSIFPRYRRAADVI